MTYTPRTRDRYRLLVSAASGVTAVGVVAATGALTGLAAEQTARQDAAGGQAAVATPVAPAVTKQRAPRRPIVWKHRPHRTVISTRVVQQASATFELGGSTPALPGPSPNGTPPGSPSPHPGPAPTPTSAPPPPPTPPTPAPTSGS